MKIQAQGDVLSISEIGELTASQADQLRRQVRDALPDTLKGIEIDLSQTQAVDSRGLGALIAVYKLANHQNGPVSVRLLNPAPSIQQLIELTRMHRLFEIVNR